VIDWNDISRRRVRWTENKPLVNSETCAAPRTISRGLSLTSLEPMVADLISAGITSTYKRSLNTLQVATLKRNIQDEETHERALTNAIAGLSNYLTIFEDEAKDIIKDFDSLPDHPIVKAAVLENGLFFVLLPLYRFYGSLSLTITANSISGDEIIHVQTHRAACKELGLKPSRQLLGAVRDIVAWVTQDIDTETEGLSRPMTQARCLKNCQSLLTRGVSDFFEAETGVVLAPYEIASTSLDSYGRV